MKNGARSRAPSNNSANILYGFLGIATLVIASVLIYQLWNSKSANEGFYNNDAFNNMKSKCSLFGGLINSLKNELNNYDDLVFTKSKIVKPITPIPLDGDTTAPANNKRAEHNYYNREILSIDSYIDAKKIYVNSFIDRLNGSPCAEAVNTYLNTRYPNGKNIFQKAS